MLTFQWNSLGRGDRVLAHDEAIAAPSPQPTAVAAASTRRCWRCLQDFACDADALSHGPTEWWVCEACHSKLFP